MNEDSAHYHDSEVYQDRENTKKQNANLFLSNNANPFLISPYNFPSLAAYAKNDVVADISSIISISFLIIYLVFFFFLGMF